MSAGNRYDTHAAEHVAEAARREVEILRVLAQEPCSQAEICDRFGLNLSTCRRVLQQLRRAEVVYRVPGTHLVALVDP